MAVSSANPPTTAPIIAMIHNGVHGSRCICRTMTIFPRPYFMRPRRTGAIAVRCMKGQGLLCRRATSASNLAKRSSEGLGLVFSLDLDNPAGPVQARNCASPRRRSRHSRDRAAKGEKAPQKHKNNPSGERRNDPAFPPLIPQRSRDRVVTARGVCRRASHFPAAIGARHISGDRAAVLVPPSACTLPNQSIRTLASPARRGW